MSLWAWVQPIDRIWKIVTDPENGMIKIYNEKDELISEHKDLEKEDISLIEEHFLKIVASRLTGEDMNKMKNDPIIFEKIDGSKVAIKIKKDDYNPMYV